jgi:hypothetical protein
MSKVSGVLLILAGVGLVWQILPSGGERTDSIQQFEVTNAPSPSTNQASPRETVRTIERTEEAVAAPHPHAPVPASTASAPAPETVLQHTGRSTVVPSLKPVPPRDSLALELQRELRRVGCYEGQLNGDWTPSTRSAMRAFIDRVNAALPVAEPDYVLLALVQNHPDTACGTECPRGQGLNYDGRCLPNAILAKRRAQPDRVAAPQKAGEPVKPAPVISGWSTTTTAVTPLRPSVAPPIEGRMALAGPMANLKPADASPRKSVRPRHDRANQARRHRFDPPVRYVQRRGFNWSRALFRGTSLF